MEEAGDVAGISLPIIRPTLPPVEELMNLVRTSWESGCVTLGNMVRELEQEVCRQTGARHAVAVSSCTAGLMLAIRALALPPGSEVILPSFTFAATAQAVVWNGLIPVFCDCLPGTCTLDPQDVERNLSTKTSGICPVSVYGVPPDLHAVLDLGGRKGVPVYFDSAQGLGATYQGRPLGGFGACEVFSMSPTKVVTAIEGGLLTTNDGCLAERVRSMRDYGKDPVSGEETVHLGLSARMSELHAAVGLLSLRKAHELVQSRLDRITVYRERLGKLPGCWVQAYPNDRTTSGNYFVLFITERARRGRDQVYKALREVGIQSKRYFYPPVHQHSSLTRFPFRVSPQMTHTVKASREALALPLYSHMTLDQLKLVCSHVERLLS